MHLIRHIYDLVCHNSAFEVILTSPASEGWINNAGFEHFGTYQLWVFVSTPTQVDASAAVTSYNRLH